MGIINGKLLFYHGISNASDGKNLSTKEYNEKTVYDCFNNTFTSNFVITALNLPPITIDDRPHPHKRSRYTPDMLPVAISVASENSVSTLNTPSDSEQLFLLPTDNYNPLCEITKYEPYRGSVRRGYCCKKHDEKYATKIQVHIDLCALINTRCTVV